MEKKKTKEERARRVAFFIVGYRRLTAHLRTPFTSSTTQVDSVHFICLIFSLFPRFALIPSIGSAKNE